MYKIVGGQVTGTRHLKLGEEGQDRIACYRDDTGACIALADGAGSRRMSQYAAEMITQQMSEYIVKNFKKLYEEENTEQFIYEKCMDIINGSNIPSKEMACTLLCYAIVDNCFISVHVGDGMIAYVRKTEKKVLSKPQNGSDISETCFVQVGMDLSYIRINKGLAEEGTYLLMSDGTMNSLFSKKDLELTEAVHKLAQWMESYEEPELKPSILRFLNELCRRNTQDDMSIHIMKFVSEKTEDEQENFLYESNRGEIESCSYFTEEDGGEEEDNEDIGYTSREMICPDEYYDMDEHWNLDRLYDFDEYYP